MKLLAALTRWVQRILGCFKTSSRTPGKSLAEQFIFFPKLKKLRLLPGASHSCRKQSLLGKEVGYFGN